MLIVESLLEWLKHIPKQTFLKNILNSILEKQEQ